MIKEFKDNPVRDTGVINRGMFEQIKQLHSSNPALAGELAISLMELVLTGEHSSDDFTINLVTINHSIVAERNAEKYDKQVEVKRNARIENLKLEEIAEMLAQGMKQVDIANKLNITKQTVSNRVNILRTEFSELLDKYKEEASQKSQVSQVYENVNVNDNENVNDNVNSDEFLPFRENRGSAPEPPTQQLVAKMGFIF